MERAPLRPVPRRPEGPVDPGQAIAFVGERLPHLDDAARNALALVELVQQDADTGALARGRKALRRSLYPLPGSGWCERAERLISDRMDDRLEAPGPARLDAHLVNCPRCVEHELRLAQAIDALVASFVVAHPAPPPPRALPAPAPEPEPEPDPEPPSLVVVEEPQPEPKPEPVALAPEPEPVVTAGVLAWRALYALAVLLAIAALVLTALGVAGVDPL